MLGAEEKPDVKYEDVGGLDSQKQEIREAVELPLTQVGCCRTRVVQRRLTRVVG
jgi:26S proteasome regulatory subunit T3